MCWQENGRPSDHPSSHSTQLTSSPPGSPPVQLLLFRQRNPTLRIPIEANGDLPAQQPKLDAARGRDFVRLPSRLCVLPSRTLLSVHGGQLLDVRFVDGGGEEALGVEGARDEGAAGAEGRV